MQILVRVVALRTLDYILEYSLQTEKGRETLSAGGYNYGNMKKNSILFSPSHQQTSSWKSTPSNFK